MNIILSIQIHVTVLFFAISAMAADKVVVVPMGGQEAEGNAVAADVLEGKTFSNTDEVGLTGTMPIQAIDPASSGVPAGYYDTTTLNVVDTDLASGNIKSGISIFGVNGTYPDPTCLETERTECEGWCDFNFGSIPSEKIACMNGCSTMALSFSNDCL